MAPSTMRQTSSCRFPSSPFTLFQGEFTTGGESYSKALELLIDGEKTLQLATVYQRYGYNLYTRGRYVDSLKYGRTK